MNPSRDDADLFSPTLDIRRPKRIWAMRDNPNPLDRMLAVIPTGLRSLSLAAPVRTESALAPDRALVPSGLTAPRP